MKILWVELRLVGSLLQPAKQEVRGDPFTKYLDWAMHLSHREISERSL